MLTHFYDIETLWNAFTIANYKKQENVLDLYLLLDDIPIEHVKANSHILEQTIRDRNKNFDGHIRMFDLHNPAHILRLGAEFGVSTSRKVNDPNEECPLTEKYPQLRITCDTDTDYDENKHPYLMGYNSYNYDTTMLAAFFQRVFAQRQDSNNEIIIDTMNTTARYMRTVSDELFTDRFRDEMPKYLCAVRDAKGRYTGANNYQNEGHRIRRNMLMSGRHVDVARLNEKQRKVALKRILGQLGYQILEYEFNGDNYIHSLDELFELLAYNTSDVINLGVLFNHKAYTSSFTLKKGLLDTYPELIYEKKKDAYAPDIRPTKVRNDRLMIDSSSAQFATKTLCPYGHLTDIETVSFDYPHADIAKELGIPRVNILEETRKFFYKLFPQQNLRERFDNIYRFYKSIEGKNFNDSKTYLEDFGCDDGHGGKTLRFAPKNIAEIAKTDNCIPYFNKDGNETSCFATFSTGGIHGAEYNKRLYEQDLNAYQTVENDMAYVKSIYPDPLDLKKAKTIEMPDGTIRPATDFLKSGSTLKHSEWKNIRRKEPVLFAKTDKGGTKLHPRYVYTSIAYANHEDFTSYYPNLLRMMKAFYNEGLGYDRYGEIFDQKSKYGKLMKDETLSKDERERYKVLREGVKLILNSASGAGDATFDSNIRVNNQIISMRIIGQLFSYRIAQAQTFQGALVPSTNTDGLYSVMEETLNNKILADEAKDIGVEIEPEPMLLISKDTNNRIEFDTKKHKVLSVSGGTLACADGPSPTKSLAHPAIVDYALREYLVKAAHRYKNIDIDRDFNDDICREILEETYHIWSPRKWLNMFQNLIASSTGSHTYIYNVEPDNPSNTHIMQHYNRVFIMKDNTPNTVHLYAAAYRIITDATRKKRARNGEAEVQQDSVAKRILVQNGEKERPKRTEAVVKKVTNIEPTWFMFIQNRSLDDLDDNEIAFIRDNIDMEKYVQLIHNNFMDNWYNNVPHPADKQEIMVLMDDKNGNDATYVIEDRQTKRDIYDIAKSKQNHILID